MKAAILEKITGLEENKQPLKIVEAPNPVFEAGLKVEGCAGADGAFDMNFAGVLLDDAVGDGKAQAGAAAVAVPGMVLVVKKGS